MAGIYIHVPFCKTRCHYCDFFKSTNLAFRKQYLEKLLEEIRERSDFFEKNNTPVQTIYFGGGTPSLLKVEWIDEILESIQTNFRVIDNVEITLEANPDDLNFEYLKAIKNIGINRLSIGVQSFFDEDLKRMGRRHNALQSRSALEWAFKAGFQNVGIDLIYGLPWSDSNLFLSNLDVLQEYPIVHLSAYHLTIEPNTQFGKLKLQKKLFEIEDSKSEKLFWNLHDKAEQLGFEHYEISNFCKEDYFSRHNSSYWNNEPYLGVGPGSHSYDGNHRYWIKPDLHQYVTKGYSEGLSCESLTTTDRFNEYLMLGLRTQKGIDIKRMMENFEEFWINIQPKIQRWLDNDFLECEDGYIRGTRKGWFVIDGVIKDLFLVD